MLGDFNEAMWQEEHFSNSARSERLMLDFHEFLSFSDLHDIGFVGIPWTFDNKQKGERNVKVRLDRVVASPSWSTLFPDHRLRHIVSIRSDHCPLLLSVDAATNCRCFQPIHRYEVAWEREPSLAAVVEEAWSCRVPGRDLGDVAMSLKSVIDNLQMWRKDNFKSIPK